MEFFKDLDETVMKNILCCCICTRVAQTDGVHSGGKEVVELFARTLVATNTSFYQFFIDVLCVFSDVDKDRTV